MANTTNPPSLRKLLRQRTQHIHVPPEHKGALEERDWLERLYLRLIPIVYELPNLSLEHLLESVPLHLTQAERQYLLSRLTQVRKKHDVAVVSRGDEDLLLPFAPGFDPRKVPLVACWCDGGFYTLKERTSGKQNIHKLRGLGLADGVAAYASFRALIFAPEVGHPAWKIGPLETGSVTSSNEAEVKAAEVAIAGVIARLEKERNVPPVAAFHLVLHTDSRSLVTALTTPFPSTDSKLLLDVRALLTAFATLHPIWQPRRLIKQKLGH